MIQLVRGDTNQGWEIIKNCLKIHDSIGSLGHEPRLRVVVCDK